MSEIAIQPIDADDLRAHVARTAEGTTLLVRGSADARSHDALERFLAQVHDQMLSSKEEEIVVDLRDCDFISSSCLKAFVVWLGRIQDGDDGARYKLRFLSDDNKPWQRRSLGTLHCFAVDLVMIASGPSVRD
ncbi:MAG: hypothetical protein R3B36_23855 [Polyangiaceae bacterium]